jgi:hypothetical protein
VHKKRAAGVIDSVCEMYAGDLRRIRQVVESPSVSGGDLQLVFAALCAAGGVAAARAGTAATADDVLPSGQDSSSGGIPSAAGCSPYRFNRGRCLRGHMVRVRAAGSVVVEPLWPGWGVAVSGTRGASTVFGVCGQGRHALPRL